MEYKDISIIKNDYDNGKYSPPKGLYEQIGSIVKDDHIFDENLSVKRNRELVVEHNESVNLRRNAYRTLENRLFNDMRNDVIEYLMGAYDFNCKQAERVESFVYTEKHSFMYDYFACMDEIAGLCEDVIGMT